MIDQTFKFYFKTDESTYLYVNNGAVMATSEKKEVLSPVADWENSAVKFIRSPTYWGFFREYSVPLLFVGDGRKILRTIAYTPDFGKKCIVSIEKLNTRDQVYSPWYEGNIDFRQKQDLKDSFQVNLKEMGLPALIKLREDTPYEIPLTDIEAIPMKLDGVKLVSRASWIPGDFSPDFGGDPPTHYIQDDTRPSTVIIFGAESSTSVSGAFTQHDQAESQIANIVSLYSSGIYMGRIAGAMYNLNFAGKIKMVVTPPDASDYTIHIQLRIGNPADPSNTDYELATKLVSGGGTQAIEIDIDHTIDMLEGPNVMFLQVYCTPDPGFNEFSFYYNQDGSYLDLFYQGIVGETVCRGYRYIDLFKKLINKLTDGAYEAQSDFLSNSDFSSPTRKANWDNSPYNTIVTSGDGLRGVENAMIKTSLSELFKDVWGRWMLGLSIENGIVRLEPLSYFFSNEEIMRIPVTDITEPIIQHWNDKDLNQVKVGQGSYDNQNISGKNEFNTSMTFLMAENEDLKREEDLTCPYRADVYGIESVRAETFNQSKLDNRSDNDCFVIEVNPIPNIDGQWFPFRPAGFISGVDDPEGIYNVCLSPKRALLRHLPRLKAFAGGEYQYQVTDKNPELASQFYTEDPIYEKFTINVDIGNDYGNILPLFKPDIIEFECAAGYNLTEILNLQTRGYITFVQPSGEEFRMYLLDAGCYPATRERYTFRGVSHRDNNLLNFFSCAE